MENNKEEKKEKKFNVKTHAKIVYILYIFQIILMISIFFKIGCLWILFESIPPMLILGIMVLISVKYKKKPMIIFMGLILFLINFISVLLYFPLYWSAFNF